MDALALMPKRHEPSPSPRRPSLAATMAGPGLLTAADVHHGWAEHRVAARATVLAAAYAAHPERFPAGLPRPPAPPLEVWINAPKIPTPSPTTGDGTVLTAVAHK